MFMTEEDIKDMIRIEKGEITTNALIEEIKERYRKKWNGGA